MSRAAPHIWTCPEDAFLRKNYRACGAKIVADELGLSLQQVRARAHYIGIKQSRPVLGRPFAHGHDSRRKQRVEIK